MADKKDSPQTTDQAGVQGAGANPAANKTMIVRVDERNMAVNYANAFRTHPTPEEVIIDMGLNMVGPAPENAKQQNVDGQITFAVSNRCIISYPTAKRLAITLGQVVRLYEEQNGEIKLDGTK